jgi:hypothetical protein
MDLGAGLRVCLAAALIAAVAPGTAGAAVSISQFTVTPSTTQAGGHPNLSMSFSLAEPSTGVKDVAVHLPAGLAANSRAIPFCTRRRLVRNLCLPKSKAGSLVVTVVAYGIELPVGRDIFNVRPAAAEPLRLGVPILGSFSQPGIAAELPVGRRPADGGLDLAVKGLPSEVAGFPVRLKTVTVKLRGVARTRVKKKVRKTPVLTNPASCTPATSILEIITQEPGAVPLTSSTSFTPSGCGL